MSQPSSSPKIHPITILGSLNTDLVTLTPRIPSAGETLRATSFTTGFGGKGANQAVACARLLSPETLTPSASPAAVRMIGAIGDDRYGCDFLEHLRREGIGADGVRVVEGQKTGTSLIIVDEESGENRILFAEGANGEVGREVVDSELGGGGGGDGEDGKGLVVLQLETPIEGVLHALHLSTTQGHETIFNPAPAQPLPDSIYKSIHHLIVNETEASILSAIPLDNLLDSLPEAAQFFTSRGVKVVIITLGSKGVFHGLSNTLLDTEKVDAVDTTAAGDTFVGAYAACLAQEKLPSTEEAVEKAIRFAMRAAAVSVTRRGAQASIPRLEEMPPAAKEA